jgi:hypothetical protein
LGAILLDIVGRRHAVVLRPYFAPRS